MFNLLEFNQALGSMPSTYCLFNKFLPLFSVWLLSPSSQPPQSQCCRLIQILGNLLSATYLARSCPVRILKYHLIYCLEIPQQSLLFSNTVETFMMLTFRAIKEQSLVSIFSPPLLLFNSWLQVTLTSSFFLIFCFALTLSLYIN